MPHHRTAVAAGSVAAFALIAFDVAPVHAAHAEGTGPCTLPGGYETAMEAGFHTIHSRRERGEV